MLASSLHPSLIASSPPSPHLAYLPASLQSQSLPASVWPASLQPTSFHCANTQLAMQSIRLGVVSVQPACPAFPVTACLPLVYPNPSEPSMD